MGRFHDKKCNFDLLDLKFGDEDLMAVKVLYSVEDIALMDVDGELCLRDGGNLYQIH